MKNCIWESPDHQTQQPIGSRGVVDHTREASPDGRELEKIRTRNFRRPANVRRRDYFKCFAKLVYEAFNQAPAVNSLPDVRTRQRQTAYDEIGVIVLRHELTWAGVKQSGRRPKFLHVVVRPLQNFRASLEGSAAVAHVIGLDQQTRSEFTQHLASPF